MTIGGHFGKNKRPYKDGDRITLLYLKSREHSKVVFFTCFGRTLIWPLVIINVIRTFRRTPFLRPVSRRFFPRPEWPYRHNTFHEYVAGKTDGGHRTRYTCARIVLLPHQMKRKTVFTPSPTRSRSTSRVPYV